MCNLASQTELQLAPAAGEGNLGACIFKGVAQRQDGLLVFPLPLGEPVLQLPLLLQKV